MFYNCPVRKLASHSPPFCEKNNTHTYSRAQTHAHWYRCVLTPVAAQTQLHLHTHSAHSAPLPAFSHVGMGRGGGRQAVLSLWNWYQSTGTCIPRPGQSGQHLSSGYAASSSAMCSGSRLQCLPSAGTRPQVQPPAGTLFPQERHLKVQEFEGSFLL